MALTRRISREALFMEIASLYGKRSTCPRAQVGVLAVRDGRPVAAGYNGAPSGMPHCTEVGCDLTHEILSIEGQAHLPVEHCIRAVHAEANLISWAAREGVKLHGTSLFITHDPCVACAKLLVNAGVKEVSVAIRYGYGGGIELLQESKVLVFSWG